MSSIPLLSEYKVGKVLGEGTYAKVKEAFHIHTGEPFACKIFNKKLMAGREHMVLNEINILKTVSQGHPNLIGLVDYFESANNLYVIMEIAKGGELFYRICNKGHYYEHDAAQIVRTICDAVAYLHDKGIVHRDLKPENLLFRTEDEDSDLLIADFGLARCLESDSYPLLTTMCGTPGFMSPELLERRGYSKPVDMWAIGVITYFLLSGYTPFDRNTTVEEIQAIINADYAFEPAEYWTHVSETAKNFVRGCLKLRPEERLTAREALAHPWLANVPLKGSQQNLVAANSANNLLPNIRENSRSATDKLRKAVRTMQAASHFAKLSGQDPTALPQVPMPVDEPMPSGL
ncbi:CAMK/CAMK1 protein kinase [Catenaria anguillulae PL171]|uniref:CAMK/CAMK1 protein kinase n=1 Tax=Catenaria anguillulae PL171 TaxID=765915 RepID=A0A1Y2HW51_9FUNG|nr:CAMK/CAMK1 protein kinase [Catenaria anguillulae PL171]